MGKNYRWHVQRGIKMRNKKRTIEQIRHAKLVNDGKCRGGRPPQVIKDKTKYDRKRDKKVNPDD